MTSYTKFAVKGATTILIISLIVAPFQLIRFINTIVLMMIVLLSQLFLRLRKIIAAGLLLSTFLLIFTNYVIFITGGVNAPMSASYILSFLIAGLIMGRRVGVIFTIISVFSWLGIYILQVRNLIPPPLIEYDLRMIWALKGLVFIMAAVLLHLSTKSISDAFNIIKEERDFLDIIVDDRTKKLAEARQAALNQAEQSAQAKSDFLANMSHEIRTPMNAIIGNSQLALKTDLTAKQQNYISQVQTSTNALLGLINDLLDFSKIKAGNVDIEHMDFDLAEVLENVSKFILQRAKEKGLKFSIMSESEVPSTLVGDPLRLEQILTNLTINAVKFTERGEIVVSVKSVNESDKNVLLRFEVRDTGIGMTKRQSKEIFKAFSQVDSSFSRKYGGTGLGLATSKRLSELMGGDIGVESEPGKGSTFFFTANFGLAKEIIEPKSKPEPDLEQHKAIELKEAIHVDQNSEDVDIKKSSVEINSPTIKTMITDLRKYLDDSNAASHESFEKLNKELSQHGFESSLQRLGKSVGEYNMEDALKILAELEEDINNL
ncbi:MAG: hypothetical protein IH964_13700 [Candidatus Dadabacteria bacterium]|nr:hypothetical protein [Candidatus Dadabacteria bacterium]